VIVKPYTSIIAASENVNFCFNPSTILIITI
jgi:hypothetical protein